VVPPGVLDKKLDASKVSQVTDNSERGGITVRGFSHIGRTFQVTPKKKSVDLSKTRSSQRKSYFPVRVGVRMSGETFAELDLVADYVRRSRSETLRQIIEVGMKSFTKEPGYRRYLKKR
jgi:hypothetical protein